MRRTVARNSTAIRAKSSRERADNTAVHHPVWRFLRGDETLTIGREQVDDGVMLVMTGDGAPRSYFFRDIARLEVFQRDMETLLLKTGWTFQEFSPDRRAGRDRRGWPRRSNDRRRWWTDGQATAAKKTSAQPEPLPEQAPTVNAAKVDIKN